MAKTPDYVKKATAKYQSNFDLIQVRLPKGTKERIKNNSENVNQYISGLVLADLDRLENQSREIIVEGNKEPRKADKKEVEKAD